MNVKEVTYGNCRTREHATRDEEQVATEGRVGEMGETLHGRDDEAAAATGPGMKTTDHLQTDGVSLATPASGPRDDQKADFDLVKPPQPPLSVASTTPPKQTQLHANETHGMGRVVAGRDDDDEDCQAHERADDPAHRADTSTDETAATATASASMDAAAPHHDQAKATRDQGLQPATSASAPSASCDHPGEDAVTTDPPRPSEDPVDVTGDNERRPDTPTEPPDLPEGTRRQWGEERAETGVSEVLGALRGSAKCTADNGIKTHQPAKPGDPDDEVEGARVEAVETAMLKVSRSVEEGPGEVIDEERRPGKLEEPPGEAQVESNDPDSVQVEPGGKTIVERGGDIVHEDTDATTDGMAEEAHGGVQDEAERSAMCRNASIEGERGSPLARG